ncbi:MAG: GlcNAc-transferase family protein [Ignavibacteria bacterium]
MAVSPKIFVQIPSYRDSQLVCTIDSLINQAKLRKRLKIAVCWQHSCDEELPGRIHKNNQIHIDDFGFRKSRGANWARSIVQKNWRNEEYTLVIDSHTRMVKDWDEKLIEMYMMLKRAGVKKPILTGYPPPYEPGSYPQKRLNYPLKMYVEGYYFNLLTKFNGRPIPHFKKLDSPVPAQFLSIGFLFTDGSFNKQINFDPNIYFYGDEITAGLRAYCHGYDFYHPHRLVAWHLYERKTRIPHWDTHENWRKLDADSCRRIRLIFKGKKFKNYPLGNVRNISDYEDFIGKRLILNSGNS